MVTTGVRFFAVSFLLFSNVFSLDNASAAAIGPQASSSRPLLELSSVGGQSEHLDRAQLAQKFGEWTVSIHDQPAYHQPKAYRGVSFKKILRWLLGLPKGVDSREFVSRLKNYVVEITCTDGYQPVLDAEMFFNDQQKALLAYQELDSSNWWSFAYRVDVPWSILKDNGNEVNPGPFYLVWNTAETFPSGWPYQVAKVRLVSKLESVKRQLSQSPEGFKGNLNQFNNGAKIFTNNCMSCHAINGVGANGGRAPDLGEALPNVTDNDIRTVWLPKMEDGLIIKKLSQVDIDNLIGYLRDKTAKTK